MTAVWKAAGLTYNRYLTITARVLRRSLKEEARITAERRAITDLRFTKWQDGKPGEAKDLTAANLAAMAESASSS